MASTRNNNTPGNYCLQQRSYQQARQETIYKHSAYGEAYSTKWAGNGLNPGQLPWNTMSKNAPDIFEIMNQYEQEFFACSDYPLPVRIKTGYFNAGFTGIKKSLINKCSMNYINKKIEKYKNKEHFDQCALNEIVKEKCNSYVQLSKSWNIFPPRDIDNYDPFYGVHYIHYYKDAWKYKDQAKERLNLIEKCEGKITFHQTTLNKIKYFPEYWKNTEKGILEFKT